MGIHIAHYDLRFFKPLDEELLHEIFQTYPFVITLEDGCITGGAGTAVMEFMADHGYKASVKRLGLPDSFAIQGSQEELHRLYNYDKDAIINTIKELYATIHPSNIHIRSYEN